MASADGNPTPAKDEMNSAPTQCASGCGFFGNPQTGGMCSKCYKETLAKQAAAAPAPSVEPKGGMAASPPAPTPTFAPAPSAAVAEKPAELPAAASSSAPAAEAAAAPSVGFARPCEETADEEEPPKKVQVNTSRCWTCNRKIGLLGFQCKCEFFFCAEHRYSDKHECAFDYKSVGRKQLEKQNPTIAPSKIESIN